MTLVLERQTSTVTDLYVKYASEITDAPAIYSRWLSYLILSSVVNRNIYMSGGIGKIYPNFYFLIVGPSSVYRKSFSQKLALSFIRQIYPDFQIADVSSREAFISELAREDRIPVGAAVWVIDEMAGFMGRIKSSPHFQGMVQDLSTAFSGEPIHRRAGISEEKKQVFRIDEPFLNMTAACSFDWLTKSIETSDLTGGFLARFLWIVSSDKEGAHWSEAKPGDAALRGFILDRLRAIKDVMGEMKWSAEAKERWDYWYSDFRTRNQGGKWDANYERMTMQVRKIAMLNAAQDLTRTIERYHLDRAINMTEPLVERLKDIVIGESKEEIMRNRIYSYLLKQRPKPVSRTNLLNFIANLDAWNLTCHVKTLIEMDKIEGILVPSTKTGGRPALMYRAK